MAKRKIEVEIDEEVTYNDVKSCIEVLCAKGIPNGAFQDYGVLVEVVSCLSQIEESLKKIE